MKGEDIMIAGIIFIAAVTILFVICRILLQVKKNKLKQKLNLFYGQNE